jgi:serine protease AprX
MFATRSWSALCLAIVASAWGCDTANPPLVGPDDEVRIRGDRHVAYFTDKDDSPYSVDDPLAFLSQAALDRRHAQGIAVTPADFPVNPAYAEGVAATGAMVTHRLKWFNAVLFQSADPVVVDAVSALPYVREVVPVGWLGGATQSLKLETDVRGLTQAERSVVAPGAGPDYGPSFGQINLHNGEVLHAAGYTGAGRIIAVIDAGFAHTDVHEAFDSLHADGRVIATWDFADSRADVYREHPHGTMVLSTMAGNLPGMLVGTAPGASYLLLRSEVAEFELIIEEYFWAAAAEFADSAGAHILTTSLGYTQFDDPSQNHTYASLDGNTTPITRASNMAAARGMVVVNGAGNLGRSAWYHIAAPADGHDVLAVGAVDLAGNHVGFSGRGPSYDGRTKPNVMAVGLQAVVATGGGAGTASGTSFSAPIIAGLAACLWQAHPNLSARDIFRAIERSAHLFATPNDSMGYGIPDFELALGLLATEADLRSGRQVGAAHGH